MRLFTVDTNYVNYLRKFESRIWSNEEKGRLRPYVGVVLNVRGNEYYAALTSPKPKHEKRRSSIHLRNFTKNL